MEEALAAIFTAEAAKYGVLLLGWLMYFLEKRRNHSLQDRQFEESKKVTEVLAKIAVYMELTR